MKTIKKEVSLQLESVHCEPINICGELHRSVRKELTFSTYENIDNIESLTHFVEVEEPETIKEFCSKHNLPKKELVEWLNEHYK